MTTTEFKAGETVWVHFPWADRDCFYQCTFIKETAKRYKVCADNRGEIYVAKKHVVKC